MISISGKLGHEAEIDRMFADADVNKIVGLWKPELHDVMTSNDVQSLMLD